MSRIRSSALAIGERYALAERLRSIIAWHSTASVLQALPIFLFEYSATAEATILLRNLVKGRKVVKTIVLAHSNTKANKNCF